MTSIELALDDDPEPTQIPTLVRAFIAQNPVAVINTLIEYGVFQNLGVRLTPIEDNT